MYICVCIYVYTCTCIYKFNISEVRETGMGWCTHVRAGKNDIFFECSHRLKRRKYQHSADQNPFRIKNLVSRKWKWAFRRAENRQAKDYYAKDNKRTCFGSDIKGQKSRNLNSCTNTHDGLKVRNTSRICQKTIKKLSMHWGTRNRNGLVYACACRQKWHIFVNFLTVWSVESTITAHTKIRSESKS